MINHLRRVRKIREVIGKPLDKSFYYFKAKKGFKKDCIFCYSDNFSSNHHITTIITFYYFNHNTYTIYQIGQIQHDLVNKSNKNVFTQYSESQTGITFIDNPSYCINNDMFNELFLDKNLSLRDSKQFMMSLFTYDYIKKLKFLLEYSYLS